MVASAGNTGRQRQRRRGARRLPRRRVGRRGGLERAGRRLLVPASVPHAVAPGVNIPSLEPGGRRRPTRRRHQPGDGDRVGGARAGVVEVPDADRPRRSSAASWRPLDDRRSDRRPGYGYGVIDAVPRDHRRRAARRAEPGVRGGGPVPAPGSPRSPRPPPRAAAEHGRATAGTLGRSRRPLAARRAAGGAGCRGRRCRADRLVAWSALGLVRPSPTRRRARCRATRRCSRRRTRPAPLARRRRPAYDRSAATARRSGPQVPRGAG